MNTDLFSPFNTYSDEIRELALKLYDEGKESEINLTESDKKLLAQEILPLLEGKDLEDHIIDTLVDCVTSDPSQFKELFLQANLGISTLDPLIYISSQVKHNNLKQLDAYFSNIMNDCLPVWVNEREEARYVSHIESQYGSFDYYENDHFAA
jgi:hypothetical protein